MGQCNNNRRESGNDSKGNHEVVLMFIQKRKRVPLQTLIGHFVYSPETGQMSESTLKSHLSKMVKRKEVGKFKDGKSSIYCVPGESLPEKMPISEADLLLLDECKKLVSDILASGLIYPDVRLEKDGSDVPDAWLNERIERRFELAQRAYSLWYIIQEHQEYRDYKIPIPIVFGIIHDWEDQKYDVMGRLVEDSLGPGTDSLFELVNYFVRVIDYLSRKFSTADIVKRPPITRAKKAAPRP